RRRWTACRQPPRPVTSPGSATPRRSWPTRSPGSRRSRGTAPPRQAPPVPAPAPPGPAENRAGGSPVTRVAAVDCGTNSVRLLVPDIASPDRGAGVALTDVLRRMEITRLGQGVDATGRIAPQALERTGAVLGDYAAQVRRLGAERVRVAATS